MTTKPEEDAVVIEVKEPQVHVDEDNDEADEDPAEEPAALVNGQLVIYLSYDVIPLCMSVFRLSFHYSQAVQALLLIIAW